MKVHYPNIEGAKNISGWTSGDKVVNISVGGTVELDKEVVAKIITTYPFLKTGSEDQKKQDDWQELLKHAKSVGINTKNKKKDELISEIKEHAKLSSTKSD